MNNALKARWAALPANARAVIAVGALFAVMVILAMALGVTGTRKRSGGAGEPVSVTNLTLPSRSSATVEQVVGRVDATQEKIKQLEVQAQRAESDRITLLKMLEDMRKTAPDNATVDVAKELHALRRDFEAMKTQPQGAPSLGAPSLDDPLSGHSAPPVEQKAPATLKIIGGDLPKTEAKPAAKAPASQRMAMSSGSFFDGVLINGMDAPTSSVTVKNPVPAVLRVKSEAVLPNSRRSDVRECFVVVSGHGVLATERAIMRTETISCVLDDGTENGKIVESKIEGWVVGEDGKVGVRGRLVSKQGQLIAQALLGSTIAGIGRAMTPVAVPQLNLNPNSTQTTQTGDFGTAIEGGVLKGFADTSKMVAQFYLDMAKDMFPVIEIDAKRRVTVMLIKGFELKE